MIRRVGKWLAALLVLTAAVTGAIAVWYVRAAEPRMSGTLVAKGLTAPVDVVRDADAVPHIFAANELDAYFAQGYVHAQDRLWQMELQRRLSNGRLAEILGQTAIDIDVLMRTLGIRRSAEAMWSRFSPTEQAPYEAYARGVNAYLAARRSPLPPEFWIVGAPSPEVWSPIDSIGWTIMMAWDLGANWRTELFRLQLLQHGLGWREISQFLPPYPGESYPPMADLAALYKPLFKDLRSDAATALERLAAVPGYVEGMGSNNWVVAGARSSTGKPLLANDPHLSLGAPSIWYLAHVSAPDGLNVIGASLPGVPGIVLGRNNRIAWGFTNTGPDVQDLFIEKINPENPGQYLTPDGWRDFATVDERLRIKGAPDRVLHVRATRHGPVVSDTSVGSIQRATPGGHALSFAWTALSPDNRTAVAFSHVTRARNWDEFVAALRDFSAPEQNIVFADIDGNIGFIAPGRVPIRKPENDLHGLMPAPGWDAKYDWAGFIPFAELPRQFNPSNGYVATANQKIVGSDYPRALTYEWAAPYRYDRIVDLIEATPKHSVATFAAMQADVLSLPVKDALPTLLAAPTAGPDELAAHDLLAKWDARMLPSRPEPLIVSAWMRELSRILSTNILGPELAKVTFDQRVAFVLDVLADRNGAGQWCSQSAATTQPSNTQPSNTQPSNTRPSNTQISNKPRCAHEIAQSLTIALSDLRKRYGADMQAWRWGTAHQAQSAHRPFTNVPFLKRFFDIRVADGGDSNTVNVGRYSVANEAEPFTAVHGPSLRAIYDLSALDNSVFIQSTGQSGNVLSSLYANYAQRWADVKYIPMQTDRSTIERRSMGTLRLQPQ